MNRVDATIRGIAALGLSASADAPVIVESDDNDLVLRQLREHRIEGVAVRSMAEGALEADEVFSASLVRQHDETMAQCLRVEMMAVSVSELFADHGIAHRLLKGSALAHTVASAPSDRSFRDVDLLVPSPMIDDAVAMLEYEGATRHQPQLRPGFDERFGKSVTMSLDGVEVDIHRVLAPGPFGVWMRPSDLFLLGASVEVGGISIPTLDTTEHLVHACYHAALGSVTPSLVNLRDIGLLAAADWDFERFTQTVDRWKGRAVVQRAVRLVEEELGIELDEGLRAYRHNAVPQAEAAAIEPYLTSDPRGRFAALVPSTFRALPMSERASFARAVGLPDGVDPSERVRSIIDRLR